MCSTHFGTSQELSRPFETVEVAGKDSGESGDVEIFEDEVHVALFKGDPQDQADRRRLPEILFGKLGRELDVKKKSRKARSHQQVTTTIHTRSMGKICVAINIGSSNLFGMTCSRRVSIFAGQA